MSAAPRTPPRISGGLLSKNGAMPLTPDSVLSPPRSGGRRATAGEQSIDSLDVITLWDGEDEPPPSPVSESDSGGIGLVGVRNYIGAREFDDDGKRRTACSTTVGRCPIAGHGPMRFGCSFAGDTMCSNCGCVMCVDSSSIGREVVLLDENSSSTLFGTVISIQDGVRINLILPMLTVLALNSRSYVHPTRLCMRHSLPHVAWTSGTARAVGAQYACRTEARTLSWQLRSCGCDC